ncbi:adaptin ear-binding coat-associated protein 1-like isoform X3 [Hibiscus syriacus]|uniref:adaptin ear-binding coat-associated protein 1-like isoform X3 n=1 Tax=Hibiscus syriacus TaxID=106335 RepID=UPI001922BD5F|nr:adaptin ear-binding coat-associated protein 1-like isoform X3 [Hibiscus syriacus]
MFIWADEWNVNKWAWEGILKVINKGEECIIRLEDKNTGELYARAFLRNGEPHPVESVVDSSRYFVLRIEENIGGRQRHAFIGIGFRERTEAYDFQAALHDHIKYLNKKKTAEEMEQQFQSTSSVDYSLKEGETIVLQLKNTQRGSSTVKSKASELGIDKLSLADKGNQKDPMLSIMLPPPPPPGPLSPVGSTPKSSRPPPPSPLSPVDTTGDSPTSSPSKLQLEGTSEKKAPISSEEHTDEQHQGEGQSTEDVEDDDFGDFQAAG